MVLFFTSTVVDPPVMLYMGKDMSEIPNLDFNALFLANSFQEYLIATTLGNLRHKVENEDLIKYAWPQDVWFHVDKLSSAHVYIRMPPTMTWDSIPQALLTDCAQLVKANSIEGNKKDNLTIIYTPGSNLKKSGDMAVGQVSFHSDKQVKRVHIQKRENVIVNRLNKTKVERDVDHEQERVERIKKENAEKRVIAAQNKKAEAELAKAREAEKASRSYDLLFEVEEDPDAPKLTGKAIEEDFM